MKNFHTVNLQVKKNNFYYLFDNYTSNEIMWFSLYVLLIAELPVLFFSVLVTGLLTELVSKKLEHYKPIIISYSVAIVLTLLCTHIIPELFSGNNHKVGYFLLGGFVLQILLELLSKGIEHGHVHLNGEISNKQLLVIFIGLSLHSFIEGIPIKTFNEFHGHTHSLSSTSFVKCFLI